MFRLGEGLRSIGSILGLGGRTPKRENGYIADSLPHPDLLHVASDRLVLRYPQKRANYIASWNEHVDSPERTARYTAWQAAESIYNTSVARNRRDARERGLDMDNRRAGLESFDMAWVITDPTNLYRAAFYAYDHLRGTQFDEERGSLFRALAARRPREKQQKTLQGVEEIYRELTRPLSWRNPHR